ncbi:hypothetical protein Acr_18g0009700 [Actinidia rufa]|uniref:Uncharacterized protein n=1 Tax=Actinidia rufa TaxID=165716 RepID=A0A7J0G7M9_9ERIC|nr:hypothetical protein Acr_18g0009700 [Actinidia rufa]
MATQKDRIEKLEVDMGKLKDLVKALATESQRLATDAQEKGTSIKGIERSLNDLLGRSSRTGGDGDRGSSNRNTPPVRQKEDQTNFPRPVKMKFPQGGENTSNEVVNQREEDTLFVEEEPQISLHALAGYTRPHTMRVTGRIGYRKVLILVDSGSTHNFVDQRVAQLLGLAVKPIVQFWVTVANGERLLCTEKYEGVSILIQGLEITVTLYSLQLTGLDVVLGIQWLEKLGPVVCDWGKLSMIITKGNRIHELVAQCTAQG